MDRVAPIMPESNDRANDLALQHIP
ncbi:protein of unknown function [Cupriavidus taiwanensis]|nr:protein of unknown function [Cupriavidus taiwanensis]